MKKILLLVLVLACALLVLLAFKNKKSEGPTIENSDVSNTQANKEENLPEIFGSIATDHVSIFKIGAPIPSQDSLSGAGYSITETTEYPEGMPQKVYIVSKNDEQILDLWISYSDTIGDISTRSPEFTTKEGIAVGSTISEFITAYPDYRLWHTLEEGEKFVLNITKDQFSPQFFLNRNDLVDPKKDFWKKEIRVSDFKADARIQEIRVY